MKAVYYIAILFVLGGCTDANMVVDEYQLVENSVWKMDAENKFQFDVTDTLAIHNLYVNMRNTSDYRYSNLYVFITTTFPNGSIALDTVECPIADPITGQWYGKGVGDLWDNRVLFKQSPFPFKGTYTYTVQQAMRQDLGGVTDVGFRVEKNDGK